MQTNQTIHTSILISFRSEVWGYNGDEDARSPNHKPGEGRRGHVPPNNKNHAVIGGLHNCNAMQRNNPHADAHKKTSVRTIGAARQ